MRVLAARWSEMINRMERVSGLANGNANLAWTIPLIRLAAQLAVGVLARDTRQRAEVGSGTGRQGTTSAD